MAGHGRARLGRAVAGALLAGWWLAGCAAGDGGAAATPSPEGTWVGTLRTVAGRCPTAEPSDLTVTGDEIRFVPGDGVLVLRGRRGSPDPDALHAQLLGSDASHHPLPMVFEGRAGAGGVLAGTYGTPTCRATIAMRHPDRSLLARIRGT